MKNFPCTIITNEEVKGKYKKGLYSLLSNDNTEIYENYKTFYENRMLEVYNSNKEFFDQKIKEDPYDSQEWSFFDKIYRTRYCSESEEGRYFHNLYQNYRLYKNIINYKHGCYCSFEIDDLYIKKSLKQTKEFYIKISNIELLSYNLKKVNLYDDETTIKG